MTIRASEPTRPGAISGRLSSRVGRYARHGADVGLLFARLCAKTFAAVRLPCEKRTSHNERDVVMIRMVLQPDCFVLGTEAITQKPQRNVVKLLGAREPESRLR
jgi:hypothetical protein